MERRDRDCAAEQKYDFEPCQTRLNSRCHRTICRFVEAILMQRTKWGGLAEDGFHATGFFRIEARDGVFWLVDPDGGRFISKGVNTVSYDQDRIGNSDRVPYAESCRAKYGSEHVWRVAVAERLAGWKFNTVGCWSDELVASAGSTPLASAPIVDLGATFWAHRPGQVFADVFDPEFSRHIHSQAHDRCAHRRHDPSLLGTFIDNELVWAPDWRGDRELLIIFLNLPPHRPGRVQAIELLQQHYREFSQFNAVWRTPAASWDALHELPQIAPPYHRLPPGLANDTIEHTADQADPARAAFSADCEVFAAVIADAYFELTAAAIRAADPNHLVLGSRFAYLPQPSVIAAAGRHLDVISFNCYDLDATAVIDAYAITEKPCLVSEFGFRGADSGLPNTRGAGPVVATQKERAACFSRYVTAALKKPTVVGYHWFEHADQPAEGRFDGENSNYGTVTIEDEVYVELTDAMTRLNEAAERIHGEAKAAT
jgi:agarase